MNTLEAVNMTDPNGRLSECIKFLIDTPSDPFVLNDIMVIGQQYAFSAWMMSESDVTFTIVGETLNVPPVWMKHVLTFTADGTDLLFNFDASGTYYLYHPQLEIGDTPTDWTPAPEDLTDEMNTRFAIESNKIEAQFTIVRESINDLGEVIKEKYIKTITENENGISITDSDGIYEIQVDNVEGVTIRKDGQIRSQLIDNDFYTGNIVIEVEERAQFGNFAFVPRSDGSLSFLKVGG